MTSSKFIKTLAVTASLYGQLCFAAPSYTHGLIDITESFSNKIVVRWSGPNDQACNEDDVIFTEASVGGAEAFQRAFSITLAAAASGKPIRFKLDQCFEGKQLASLVQYCVKSDCSY